MQPVAAEPVKEVRNDTENVLPADENSLGEDSLDEIDAITPVKKSDLKNDTNIEKRTFESTFEKL